jgi:hypothetical protein
MQPDAQTACFVASSRCRCGLKPCRISSAIAFLRLRGPKIAVLLLFFLLRCASANAQSFQFLPEIDAYYKIDPAIRFDFQAKETREAGDPTQVEIGPSLDFFIKPLLRLRNNRIFDPDDTKSRLMQWFVGYRYVPSPNKSTVERMEVGFISNLPLVADILFSDRNRADLDWSAGQFTWRYRNRAQFQRAFDIRSYKPAPYASVEFFYQSQYEKWSTTALYAGCLLPIGKRFSLDPYYEHQNITGKHPNEQLNQFGIILNMHFGQLKQQ